MERIQQRGPVQPREETSGVELEAALEY